jgi:hypothetical protein
MRKKYCDFRMNYTSETGAAAENNSYFGFTELDDFACWIAIEVNPEADRGIAMRVAKKILADFERKPTICKQEIKRYLLEASQLAGNGSKNRVLRVSLAMAVTDYSELLCIVTGNERLYHFKSRKQSATEALEVLELGVSEDEERTRLGDYRDNRPLFGLFVARTVKLSEGDVILICNRGLWQKVSPNEFVAILQGTREPFVFLNSLKGALMQKQAETALDYTAAAIFTPHVYKKWPFDYKKSLIALTGVSLFILGLAVFQARLRRFAPDNHGAAPSPQQTTAQESSSVSNPVPEDFAFCERTGDRLMKEAEYQKALDQYGKAFERVTSQVAKERIQKKLGLTQVIVNADRLAAAEEFQAALGEYKKVQKTVERIPNYDWGLLDRILVAQTKLTVQELIARADREVNQKDFQAAWEYYIKAQALATRVAYNSVKHRLESKIKKTEEILRDDLAIQQLAKLQAEREQDEQEELDPGKPERESETTPVVSTGWTVYDYTGIVEPPHRFQEGNAHYRMADFCTVTAGALALNTMANPAAVPSYKIAIPGEKPAGFKFTVVARAKADSKYGIDFDLRAVGLYERVRLRNNQIRLKSSGKVSASFTATKWHTYCIAFEAFANADGVRLLTKVYIDGGANPAVQGISTTPGAGWYFRFGDGSGTDGYLGALDWIAWSFDDAYSPAQVNLPARFGWR